MKSLKAAFLRTRLAIVFAARFSRIAGMLTWMNLFRTLIHVAFFITMLRFTTTVPAAQAYPPESQLPSKSGLPNALVMFDGTPVTTKKVWLNKRRPELKELFQHYMY